MRMERPNCAHALLSLLLLLQGSSTAGFWGKRGHGRATSASVESGGASSAVEVLPAAGVCIHRGAFTSEECDAIVALMSERTKQKDVREAESVSRTNYFDHDGKGDGKYSWIYRRVLECAAKEAGEAAVEWGFDVAPQASAGGGMTGGGEEGAAGEVAFGASHVDFILMHEFRATDFFDWHVDTKPGDGTGRTVNVNVMLSDPGTYEGGGLKVGSHDVDAKKGDLYWYPAAYPHKVDDIEDGLRYSLVIAVKTNEAARAASDYWQRAEANFLLLSDADADADADAKVAVPSKWHWLHAEHLAALGRDDEADRKFADAYAATPQAAEYARAFDEDGQRLVAAGDYAASLRYFAIAARVDPTEKLYRDHLSAIESALNG